MFRLPAVKQSREPVNLCQMSQLTIGFLQFLRRPFNKVHQPRHQRTMLIELRPRRYDVGLSAHLHTFPHAHSHQRHIGDHDIAIIIAHKLPISIKTCRGSQMPADSQFLLRIAAQKHPTRHTAHHKDGFRLEAGHLFLQGHGVIDNISGVTISQPQPLTDP